MSDNKINITFEEYNKENFVVFFRKNGNNMGFTFQLYEFVAEMDYWGFPNEIVNANDEYGFLFNQSTNKEYLTMEINRFIKHNDLEQYEN